MFKAKAVLFFYQLITFLAGPLGMLFLMYKKRRDPPYGKRKWELLGFCPVNYRGCIWFHTVSVGEVIAARPVIEAFVKRHRKLTVIVTTTTTTGAAAAQRIPGVTHLYAPLDSPSALYRFFNAVKPRHLFIMETELWPNLLNKCKKHRTHVTIFNARMPESTCRAYEKHLDLVRELIASKLNMVICQSPADAQRFERIGVPRGRIFAVNSLKYDLKPDEHKFIKARAVKRQCGLQLVLGAISTHDGEEALVLEQYLEMIKAYPELKLVLVPRHMSGADLAEAWLKDHPDLKAQRRTHSAPDLKDFNSQILIGDTIGEIEFYLGLCDVVFMGGSFIDIGGHNPLEPAYFSLPIITGPYYYNFKEQFERLIDVHGAFLCPESSRFAPLMVRLLSEGDTLSKAGLAALEVQQAGRGAVDKTLELIEKSLLRPAGESAQHHAN